ncbi:MAG: tetratricopeptide repeat protein, partial [Phycisphaerales bacterium]|nr:tetratricopeptide repeat protein [Phycisphaerales bacterium]
EEALGRKVGIASEFGNLGLIEDTRGNLDAAEDYYQRALAINETLGHKAGIAAALGNLGLIEEMRGNLETAEDYLIRSLAINEAIGSKEGMARNLVGLGLVAMERGDVTSQRSRWTRSRDLFREAQMPHVVEQVQGWLDALPPE